MSQSAPLAPRKLSIQEQKGGHGGATRALPALREAAVTEMHHAGHQPHQTAEAHPGQPSDTAQIAQALGGFTWLWGILVLAFNIGLLLLAYRLVRRRMDTERLRYG